MNEESLFQLALNTPENERPALLDRECAGNPELRARMEALLANYTATGDWQKPPQTSDFVAADNPTVTFVGSGITQGTVIAGRYILQQKIGEGGMGEVWVARQSEPVQRRVALKLIKKGMDSRSVVTRFEQERQALAMMDHPHIARVLDGGLTPTGQPFFVMELVSGMPLTRFCDDTKLAPRQRLELFIPICQAVQHAHQKGIVHRDLKPANILVTLIDGKPVPKVIDFGVAKAIGGKLIDESMVTQFGAVVGTLEYMSPEQAGFSGIDIDTRADIYSLGVILYELLTGLRPIDAGRLRKAAFVEMIRIIQEEEPSKPSTRLSTDQGLPSLAAMRQTEPKKLMALLRGELDWVVMKCLEKQRDRRYETANALVRDIQRFLADEPVEARPPSFGYRTRKFLRRHKGSVLAASLFVLAMVIGMVGTTWGLLEARRQESLARQEAAEKEQARKDETEERARAVAAADRANQEMHIAITQRKRAKAVSDFLTQDLLAQADPDRQADPNVLLRVVVDRASNQVEGNRFADQLETKAAILHTLGVTYVRLADAAKAEKHLKAALLLRQNHLGHDHRETMRSLYYFGLAYASSRDLHKAKESMTIWENLYPRQERFLGPGDLDTLTTMNSLARIYYEAGNLKKARPLFEQAHTWCQKLDNQDEPIVLNVRQNLAQLRAVSLEFTEAAVLNQQILDDAVKRFGEGGLHAIIARTELGRSYLAENKLEQALPLLEEAMRLANKYPNPDYHGDTFPPQFLLIRAKAAAGKRDEALKLLDEWRLQQQQMIDKNHPFSLKALRHIGQLDTELGQPKKSIPLMVRVQHSPQATREKVEAVFLTLVLSQAFAADGQLKDAINSLSSVVTFVEFLFPDLRSGIVQLAVPLGEFYLEAGQFESARNRFERALKDCLEFRGERDPLTLRAQTGLAKAYDGLGRHEGAEALFRDAIAQATTASQSWYTFSGGPDQAYRMDFKNPATGKGSGQLAGLLAAQSRNFLHLKKYAEAVGAGNAALEIYAKTSPEGWHFFETRAVLGAAYLGQKKYDAAEPLLLTGYEEMKKREPTIPVRLIETVDNIIQLYEATQRPAELKKWRAERAKYPKHPKAEFK